MPLSDTQPVTIEDWVRRPPSFIFADPMHTMLIWDTEEGGGVITKHGIGNLPMRHAEAVIKALMRKAEELGKEIRHCKRQRKA
jgi:hypothetical protein